MAITAYKVNDGHKSDSYQKWSSVFWGRSQRAHAVMRMLAPWEGTRNEIDPYFWRLASVEAIHLLCARHAIHFWCWCSMPTQNQNSHSHSHGRRVERELVSAGGVITDIEVGRWTRWDAIPSIMVSESVLREKAERYNIDSSLLLLSCALRFAQCAIVASVLFFWVFLLFPTIILVRNAWSGVM